MLYMTSHFNLMMVAFCVFCIIDFPPSVSLEELLILAVLLFFILDWKCSLDIMDY